jgi:hypothetical protein
MPNAERPTAAFAANDLIAIGLLQGFVTNGFGIPHDIAIIGYDDISFAEAAAVPLSSVRQDSHTPACSLHRPNSSPGGRPCPGSRADRPAENHRAAGKRNPCGEPA